MLVTCPRGRTFDSFFDNENIRLAESLGEVVWNPYGRNMTSAEACELIEGCDTYITTWGAPRVTRQLLQASGELALVIHLYGTPCALIGEDAYCAGVHIITGRAYYAASSAEGIIACILTALRNIPEYCYRLKHKGEWCHSWDMRGGLIGKTVGIVNFDDVAYHMARMLGVFDVDILVCDKTDIARELDCGCRIKQVSAETLFSQSDIISVHASRREKDKKIDYHLLSLIKKGALLVNTACGGAIDQVDLRIALGSGRFFAVLDSFEEEPPLINDPLLGLPNVIAMPRVSGPTDDIRKVVAKRLLIEGYEFFASDD